MTTARQPVIPAACPKPLRADARRNRERILKAARAVFAEQGLDAQIDDVAKRAKVGVGTVYRHFPTKEALRDALVRERFEEIAGYAREALQREDAWEGFCELIWRAAERNAVDRAFCEIVAFTDQSPIVEESGLAASTEELMSAPRRRDDARRRVAGRHPDHDGRRRLGDAAEPVARDLAALPHDHAGRAARVVVCPGMATH